MEGLLYLNDTLVSFFSTTSSHFFNYTPSLIVPLASTPSNHLPKWPDRKLGTWSTTFLIINRVIGAGIFSTPAEIIRLTDSVGATLLYWVLGGIMTFW